MNDSVYVKQGKKYKKIGILSNRDILYDGIWMVHYSEGLTEYNNLLTKIQDLPQPTDLKKYVLAFVNKNIIIDEINKLVSAGEFGKISLNDLAQRITDAIYLNSMEKKK